MIIKIFLEMSYLDLHLIPLARFVYDEINDCIVPFFSQMIYHFFSFCSRTCHRGNIPLQIIRQFNVYLSTLYFLPNLHTNYIIYSLEYFSQFTYFFFLFWWWCFPLKLAKTVTTSELLRNIFWVVGSACPACGPDAQDGVR